MTEQRERLVEALAICEAATEGPWYVAPGMVPPEIFSGTGSGADTSVTYEMEPADAEFIAHARTGYPVALRALQTVLELHWPAKYTGGTGTGYEVGSDGDPCMECNLADREGLTPTVWPCPTVRAVTEHLGDTP